MNSERAPTCIILTILQVYDVDMLVSISLLGGKREEACSIETMSAWIEVVTKELKELGQVLTEGRTVLDSKLI